MKLAILGNSHTACLIQAHRARPDILGPEIEPVFFAAPGDGMARMRLSGGELVPRGAKLERILATTSGGTARIDLAAYDAFLLVALGYKVSPVSAAYSGAVLEAAFGGQIAARTIWRLAADIRGVSDRPILCMHKPLRIKPLPDGGPWLGYEAVLGHYDQLLADRGITLLRQPEASRVEDLRTDPAFGKEGVRLSGARDRDDDMHMNGAFGELVLAGLRQALGGAARPARAAAARAG